MKKIVWKLLLFYLLLGCTSSDHFTTTSTGISVNLDSGILSLTVYSDNVVRVVYAPLNVRDDRSSLVVVRQPGKVEWSAWEDKGMVILKTSSLRFEVEPHTGLCRAFDSTGNILLEETAKRLAQYEVMDEQVHNAFQSFRISPKEALYGLGQHQDGIMNWRGQEVTLVQTNVHAVVPFLVSTRNYGILWDNTSKTIFKDDATGMSFWSEVADKIDYYVIAGSSVDDVIAGYRQLTGDAPMFGKWAYGYWQSKERYKDAEELMEVVKTYRDKKIPIDNIVQDWCYWADYDPDDNDKTWKSAKANWSSMNYHPSTYSDPVSTLKEIHDNYNMHYMISIWPALGPETEVYNALKENGLVFDAEHWSSGYLYDAFDETARDIYWSYIRKGLMSKGVDALWMDGTEPELGDQHTFEVSEANIKKFGHSTLGSMARYLNAYSLATTTGVYENWRKDFPEKRVFILTRSGFAGQQRNAAVTWSGDINATWDIFRKQIAAGLNFSMAGVPYWTMDIGAFFLHGHDMGHGAGSFQSYEEPAYQEMYVRWFQFGAFCPIFRSHGTHTPREVWRFGSPGDPTYEALLTFDNLRYRLLPYIYSVAHAVTSDGYTMMRGLAMDFPNDEVVLDINNQYMFGPSFLVAPVTEEQHFPVSGISTREVKGVETYLPAGNPWYDFWTGTKLEGGQEVWRPTPLGIMPLYVKAGSIVPLGPQRQYATEVPEDPLEIRVYAGANGRLLYYEDENDNYNYEKGVYATIEFLWDEAGQTLTIGERKGAFPGMLENRIFNIVLVSKDRGVGGAETPDPNKTIHYSGSAVHLTF